MIRYEILPDLPEEQAREVAAMLAEAARFDRDAGFSHIDLGQKAEGSLRHLLVWLLPDDAPGRRVRHHPLAAYLRLEVASDGVGEVQYVVRREARSHGVTTALIEMTGLNLTADGGWLGTGARQLRVKAQGNHPATGRLARRFAGLGIRPAGQEWQLIAPVGTLARNLAEPAARAADSDEAGYLRARPSGLAELAIKPDDVVLVLPGAPRAGSEDPGARPGGEGGPAAAAWVSATAQEPTEYGPASVLRACFLAATEPTELSRLRERLLRAVLAHEAGRGIAAVVLLTPAAEDDVVASCRRAGFHHHRTDAMYAVEGTSS